MNKSLVSLAVEKKAIYDLLEDLGGELDEKVEAWLAQVDGELQYKSDSYRNILKELEAEAERLRKTSQEFAAAAKTVENLNDRLKGRIKTAMACLDVSAIDGELYRFKLSPGGSKLILDEANIDIRYKMRVETVVPDKERIKKALDDGIEIPGAKLEPVTRLTTTIKKGK